MEKAGKNSSETYWHASATVLGLLLKTKPYLGSFEKHKNACH